jgi:hypothetical protein
MHGQSKPVLSASARFLFNPQIAFHFHAGPSGTIVKEADFPLSTHPKEKTVAVRLLFAIMRPWLSPEGKKRFSISSSPL